MDFFQASMTEADYQRFSELVYKVAGIHLHEGKRELLQARVGKIIRRRNLRSFRQYFDMVINDNSGNELTELLNAVSTNLTYFFREEKHFQFLREKWLPQFLEATSSSTKLRGWSAGCSTGEETYSILITLLEALGTNARLDIKILGSDLSTRVLNVAARGTYPAERVETIPAALKQKYFRKVNSNGEYHYTVKPILSDHILFRRINLMEPFPFRNPLNFIFCRNVMIYFDKITQENLIRKFHDALGPNGYLFIGHSESLSGIKHSFKYVSPAIYRKP